MLRDAVVYEEADVVQIPAQIEDLLSGSGNTVGNIDHQRVQATSGLSATASIKTLTGEKPLGQIEIGDLVLTRDNGFQPVRWIGALAAGSEPRQIVIRAAALGENVPCRDLRMALTQRVLNSAPVLTHTLEHSEALIRARDLLALDGVEMCDDRQAAAGWQILLDRHELIMANDMWTETWQPEAAQLAQLPKPEREAVLTLCPKLSRKGAHRAFPAARRQKRLDLAA